MELNDQDKGEEIVSPEIENDRLKTDQSTGLVVGVIEVLIPDQISIIL